MTDWDIIEEYGKSIWDMTEEELTRFDLWDMWLESVKQYEENEED